jgi:hypothetical protein
MTDSDPNPVELTEAPQLAVLEVLQSALRMTTRSLLAAYPDSCDEDAPLRQQSEDHAYSMALLFQIRALEDTLEAYRLSIERHLRPSDPSDDDIPF